MSRNPPPRANDLVFSVGEVMLRSTSDDNRLYLTADLLAEVIPLKRLQKSRGNVFPTELKRFPPVEDVVAALDRIASRAFVA
jgi:hypothetical protein